MRKKEATYIVEFEGPDDPLNPLNWTIRKRVITTILLSVTTFVVTFASSVFSSAIRVVAVEFGVSDEVATLGTSLFVVGFAVGPLIWGPLSELFGRKWPLLIAYGLFAIFQIPVATAHDLATIMICRFFGGVFASSPLGIVGGALADIWTASYRAAATAGFALAVFVGPAMGPIVGGFITQSYLGWRWTEHITYIMAFLILVIDIFFLPETYGPVLLKYKAKKLRHEREIWAIHARQEEKEISVHSILQVYLLRPLKMLVLEPMILLLTIYVSFVYGVIYLLFSAFPIAYQQTRGWNDGVGALPFLGISIGAVVGAAIIVAFIPRYQRKMAAAGGPVPEERLPPMMVGGILFPIGLFWWSWTSYPTISWVPQVIAGVPLGTGIVLIFLQTINYLIDAYLMHANSAIAANTFMRSFFGAGFPMFAVYCKLLFSMLSDFLVFDQLGLRWGGSLLGFIALAMTPIPFVFYKYGYTLRKMSKMAPTKEEKYNLE
jgi:MFS transporter, DHA1 family, multidrug resistance protein